MDSRRHLALAAWLVLVIVYGGHGVASQTPQTPAQPAAQPRASVYERYTQPIAIFKNGLGTFTKPISSRNAEAQAYFDQGFQMMYSF
ncbi:MAG TPA: hypothetical protein VMS54_13080, partial [Vicinamibacterales bacterium]|nr:hypothetical protein [Vicinamibacterales bacterium]